MDAFDLVFEDVDEPQLNEDELHGLNYSPKHRNSSKSNSDKNGASRLHCKAQNKTIEKSKSSNYEAHNSTKEGEGTVCNSKMKETVFTETMPTSTMSTFANCMPSGESTFHEVKTGQLEESEEVTNLQTNADDRLIRKRLHSQTQDDLQESNSLQRQLPMVLKQDAEAYRRAL